MPDRLANAIVALIIALGAWAPRLVGRQRDLRRDLQRERVRVEMLEAEVHAHRVAMATAGLTLPERVVVVDDD